MISVVSVDTVAIYHGVDISKRFPLDAGWMRHAVDAVIQRMCRQAHNKKTLYCGATPGGLRKKR